MANKDMFFDVDPDILPDRHSSLLTVKYAYI